MAKQPAEHLCVHCPKHIKDLVIGQFFPQQESNALIQEAQRVSHGAVRQLGNIPERLFLYPDIFFLNKLFHSVRNCVNGDTLEIISLASGQDSDGQTVYLRGCKDKNHIGGRLLKGLQQSVEGPCRKHMHLVYDINLIFSLRRGIGNFFHNFADIVNAVI